MSVVCPACQARCITVQGQKCPWCSTGLVTIEVAEAYWKVRDLARFEFHRLFGARVPLDEKNGIAAQVELSKLSIARSGELLTGEKS